jgi:hypothetical protein
VALDDPRLWAETAFCGFGRCPKSQGQITAHVDWCRSQGLLTGCIGVLWDFGKGFFEHLPRHDEDTHGVRPYTEDVELWHRARAEARDHYRSFDRTERRAA